MDKLNWKIGWRLIKTGVAVALTILISNIFNRGTPTLAALAAVFTLQNTIGLSVRFGMYRVLGNTIGVIIATLTVLFGVWINAYGHPIYDAVAGGVGVMIVIYICTHIKFHRSIVLANASFLFVFLSTPVNDILSYGFYRIIDAVIGSVIAILVNHLLPQYVPEEEEGAE